MDYRFRKVDKMNRQKEQRSTILSVEDRILNGTCEGCDQDPATCYERDYCIYDEEYKDI